MRLCARPCAEPRAGTLGLTLHSHPPPSVLPQFAVTVSGRCVFRRMPAWGSDRQRCMQDPPGSSSVSWNAHACSFGGVFTPSERAIPKCVVSPHRGWGLASDTAWAVGPKHCQSVLHAFQCSWSWQVSKSGGCCRVWFCGPLSEFQQLVTLSCTPLPTL